jgi:hypothetical protein
VDDNEQCHRTLISEFKSLINYPWKLLTGKLLKRLEYPLVYDTVLMEAAVMHQVSAKFMPRFTFECQTHNQNLSGGSETSVCCGTKNVS